MIFIVNVDIIDHRYHCSLKSKLSKMTFASNLGQPLQTGNHKLLSTQAGHHDRAACMFCCPYVIHVCDDI